MNIRRLYLDIDGVLNAFGPHGLTGAWEHYDTRSMSRVLGGEESPITVHVSPDVIAAVARWIDDGVEVVHSTTWLDQAAIFDREHGLPVLSYVDFDFALMFDDSKGAAVRAHLEQNPADAVAWIDDDLFTVESAEATDWCFRQQICAIAPISARGITRKHIEVLDDLFS